MQRLQRAPFFAFLLAIPLAVACVRPCFAPPSPRALYQEGQALTSQGRAGEALQRFTASLAASRERGDAVGTAHNLNEMGIIFAQRMEWEKAMDCFEEAETAYRGLGMEAEVSKAMNNRAMTSVLRQDPARAAEIYMELLEWDTATQNDLGRAITYTNLGHLYEVHLEEPGKALAAYERGLSILTELGDEGRSALLQKRVERLSMEGKR